MVCTLYLPRQETLDKDVQVDEGCLVQQGGDGVHLQLEVPTWTADSGQRRAGR